MGTGYSSKSNAFLSVGATLTAFSGAATVLLPSSDGPPLPVTERLVSGKGLSGRAEGYSKYR